jgi:hypothetical protein
MSFDYVVGSIGARKYNSYKTNFVCPKYTLQTNLSIIY